MVDADAVGVGVFKGVARPSSRFVGKTDVVLPSCVHSMSRVVDRGPAVDSMTTPSLPEHAFIGSSTCWTIVPHIVVMSIDTVLTVGVVVDTGVLIDVG